MSAIAYITDSKMLELHRLNNHRTINFWRPSGNINFTEFGEGDLLFFLSKDKEHRKGKEKGIVGFGRMVSFSVTSVKTMWERYGIYNGYRDLDEFKEAILRVTKDRKLPNKIAGFYLEDVTFFQPVYLSECGMKISSNVESYIYLKPEEVVVRLLDLAKESKDLWSDLNNNEIIDREKLLYVLGAAHKLIGDIPDSEKGYKRATRILKQFKESNEGYEFIRDSRSELYRIGKNSLDIVFYYDKQTDERLLIGQAQLYRYHLSSLNKSDVPVRFLTSDRNERVEYYMNALL
ncbi:MAG: hypothetical protein IJU42_04010 [Erysipelotrichaceae bacterium]|jgi:hypothetical protein|nr:hypothetical protein [Erysipelotrichaceae bacterium]